MAQQTGCVPHNTPCTVRQTRPGEGWPTGPKASETQDPEQPSRRIVDSTGVLSPADRANRGSGALPLHLCPPPYPTLSHHASVCACHRRCEGACKGRRLGYDPHGQPPRHHLRRRIGTGSASHCAPACRCSCLRCGECGRRRVGHTCLCGSVGEPVVSPLGGDSARAPIGPPAPNLGSMESGDSGIE